MQEDERGKGDAGLIKSRSIPLAHALEAYSQYSRWWHGEAVAIVLYCAALLSYTIMLVWMKNPCFLSISC